MLRDKTFCEIVGVISLSLTKYGTCPKQLYSWQLKQDVEKLRARTLKTTD